MKNFKLNLHFVLLILLVAWLGACDVNKGDRDGASPNVDTILESGNNQLDEAFDKAVIVFYALPSPIETARMLKRAGATYDEKILNPTNKYSNYTSSRSMALNLGVYSADLSYANMFDQAQAMMNYMAVSKKLAEQLGILEAINDSTMDFIKANLSNRDAIMGVISETFMNSNAFLKENNRPEIATLMVVGAWVEGLYIACQLAEFKSTDKKAMVQSIVDQKLSLEDLISLLQVYEKNADIMSIKDDIFELRELFSKLETASGDVDMTVFKLLTKKVDEIRGSYVQ